jgi:hypothetical protein
LGRLDGGGFGGRGHLFCCQKRGFRFDYFVKEDVDEEGLLTPYSASPNLVTQLGERRGGMRAAFV